MGKSTISMAMFNSKLLNYQRVTHDTRGYECLVMCNVRNPGRQQHLQVVKHSELLVKTVGLMSGGYNYSTNGAHKATKESGGHPTLSKWIVCSSPNYPLLTGVDWCSLMNFPQPVPASFGRRKPWVLWSGDVMTAPAPHVSLRSLQLSLGRGDILVVYPNV